jgi:hypothetical protein
VHRVAHHFDSDRLLWLYDIHLIASRLDTHSWSEFIDLAAARRVLAICRAGLRRSVEHFRTHVPAFVWANDRAVGQGDKEMTAAYLDQNRWRARVVLHDLRALPTWRERRQLLREYAFPSAEFMRKVHAPSSTTLLFWLYARRILFGARKWLAPP